MSKDKPFRPKARLPRGFRDRSGAELAAERRMLDTIRGVYESYGFSALETPAFEYTDALGKFLPDVDRPNEGVFSLRDDDEQWLSLRYDLTAPLARYVAENFQNLPKPFRRYQVGQVWRNEKPGPGRYREFTQFDADTVGSNSPAADAELLMMTCDALEALGLKRGEYVVKVNSRKLLDGVLEAAKIDASKRGTVLRAIDKFDRLGRDGVRALLGVGRQDESGDFTGGAKLDAAQISCVMVLFEIEGFANDARANNPIYGAGVASGQIDTRKAEDIRFDGIFGGCAHAVLNSARGLVALGELRKLWELVRSMGYNDGRIQIDPSIVRGLDYYTGAVFEAQLKFPVTNEAGEAIVFGSVAGGGRYDDLVARFTGQQVPATGISIGVSRLMSALMQRGVLAGGEKPLVFVLAMDDSASSFAMARQLRDAGIRAETYVGTKRVPDQLKYADRRGAAIAVIEGSDERAKGEVTLKNLALGSEMAKTVESRAAWVKDRPAQKSVERSALVAEVRKMLGREDG